MTRLRWQAALPFAMLACAVPALPADELHPAAESQCRAGERVVYSCTFGRDVGSVCLGKGAIHYRFGPPRNPEIAISSAPDWSNVHWDSLYSNAFSQQHVRFTRDDHHYVVHWGETGPLADVSGRRISGISVLKGPRAREIARHDCTGKAVIGSGFSIHDEVPEIYQDDFHEQEDGPFSGYF